MVDIKWIGSPNYREGNHKKVGFILHWMAGYLPGTDSMFKPGGTSDIATHYGIGSRDGRGNGLEVHQYVADKDRSFGSYNDDADTRGLSIEIENDIFKPYPGKPTDAVHELVAQFIAQKIREHDMRIDGELKAVLGDFPEHDFYRKAIPGFGRSFNVTTHRSMAMKDCPGTTDVQWIVGRANQLLSSQPNPIMEEDMSLPIKLNGTHLFTLAPEVITHQASAEQSDYIKNAIAADDNWVDANSEQFDALLDAHGIPREAVNYTNGAIFDPKTGKQERGKTWSRTKEVQADVKALRELVKSQIQPTS